MIPALIVICLIHLFLMLALMGAVLKLGHSIERAAHDINAAIIFQLPPAKRPEEKTDG